jgi:catechol 2,3-dioxygenase-like lactoylglutathione lyase family enzyme
LRYPTFYVRFQLHIKALSAQYAAYRRVRRGRTSYGNVALIFKERRNMFSHVFFSVTDFEHSLKFYESVMSELGVEQRFCDRAKPWAGWHSADKTRPLFVISKPFDGKPHNPGNGQMVAFAAKNRDIVRKAFSVAITNGGSSEGEPGLRPQYHPNYYGAYFRDPDGNKICVASHGAE